MASPGLLRGRFERDEGRTRPCVRSAFKETSACERTHGAGGISEGQHPFLGRNHSAGWLARSLFPRLCESIASTEVLGYGRFSALELAAAHSGRESAYLATDCKGKGKNHYFFFFFILLFKLSGGRHCLRLGDPHY